MRNAIHDDMEYENRMATISAINKIVIPIDRGLNIRHIFIARDRISNVIVRVIYKYEDCTHSANIKGLCALYTILYIKHFISKCKGIGRFILRLQNVNIMQQLRIQNGD